MYRRALDRYGRSLGKEHLYTKSCAKNLGNLLAQGLMSVEKMRELVHRYPQLTTASTSARTLLI